MIRSLSLLILLGFIWGSGYSIARYAMTHGVAPLGYAFWQSLGPAVALVILTMRQWQGKLLSVLRFWPYFLITGVLGIFMPNTNMYFASPHLPAGMLAVIVNIVPLMVYPLALLFKEEKFDGLRITGVLCGVLGIMIIMLPKSGLLGGAFNSWMFMALLTPLCFALCVIYIAKYRPIHLDALMCSAGMLTASAMLLIPVVHWTGSFYALHMPLHKVDWIILLEIALSSTGYVLLFKLIKMAGPVYYSLVSGVVTLTGLFWGKVIFGESLTPHMIFAVLFILTAITLVTIRRRASLVIE
ncbi:MAG: multidrug ABC transporter permease [Legionellaceae bacterium]|nr:multidrug ABC transporter permease [Legionellaceae bacterium]